MASIVFEFTNIRFAAYLYLQHVHSITWVVLFLAFQRHLFASIYTLFILLHQSFVLVQTDSAFWHLLYNHTLFASGCYSYWITGIYLMHM